MVKKGTSQQTGNQLAGSSLFVRLFPGLSVAALKAGLAKELALWCELRAINTNGSSRLILNEAVAALVEHFDYTQATAYRLLNEGDGKLWDIKRPPGQSNSTEWHSTIKIYSLLRVAEWFSTYPGRAVEIKASDFRGRQAKTAWLYASFFKPDGSRAKPISRDSIEAATGVLRRQQIRYDKVAGVKRVFNGAFQQDGQGKLTPMLHLVKGKCREWLKQRRLGNTYHSRAFKAHKGMTKKVNAKLRHRSFNLGEASCVPRRFFLSAKSLIRSSERDKEAFLLVNKRDRIVSGRMEWCIA